MNKFFTEYRLLLLYPRSLCGRVIAIFQGWKRNAIRPNILRAPESDISTRIAGGLRRPPIGGHSRGESPKGAIVMVYSKSKSSCFSASSCSRIYLRMVSSSKPTVLTQYPRLQKCLPFVCLFLAKYRWIRTALLPFRNPITNATLNFGGTLRHMWI